MSEQVGSLKSGQVALVLVSLLVFGGCTQEVSVFSGLKPDSPPALTTGCAPVTSRQPTLRWQAFAARESTGSQPGISGVTYELRIWESVNDAPGKLAYLREGLPEPSHTVQDLLSIATSYFWSIRAQFLLDGVPRVSDWGQQLRMNIIVPDTRRGLMTGDSIDHQYYQYYCFRIPEEKR